MLSVFPNLFTYSMLAPFILRVVVGVIFLELGYLKLGKEKSTWSMFFQTIHFRPSHLFVALLATIEIVAGAFLVVGYLTQIAALVMAVILFAEAYVELRDGSLLKRDVVFYTLLLVICVSLLLTGAGAFAFDLPL
jgi:putative oxidoreductase